MTWLQHWTEVLFLHFPVSTEELASRLPPQLDVDTYDGTAWLSYVFFRLKLRPSWSVFLPGLSSLVELNVRTYVRYRGQSGIYFLRMYADNRLAILASRCLTPLAYELAAMCDEGTSDGSRRIDCCPAALGENRLSLTYCPSGLLAQPPADSLDAWLLERYRLFVNLRGGRLLVGEVEHTPWTAAPVSLSNLNHTLSAALGFSLPAAPILSHHSPGVAARFHPFRAVAGPQNQSKSTVPKPIAAPSVPSAHFHSFGPTRERPFSRRIASRNPNTPGSPLR